MTSEDLVAMIPVDHELAEKQDWAMPLPGLLHRLEEKTKGRLLRADEGFPAHRPDALDQRRSGQFLACTAVQERWVDHTLTWWPGAVRQPGGGSRPGPPGAGSPSSVAHAGP
jgi:hypothetical protein